MLLPQKADTKGGTISPSGTSFQKPEGGMTLFSHSCLAHSWDQTLYIRPPVSASLHHLALAWGTDAAMFNSTNALWHGYLATSLRQTNQEHRSPAQTYWRGWPCACWWRGHWSQSEVSMWQSRTTLADAIFSYPQLCPRWPTVCLAFTARLSQAGSCALLSNPEAL